MKAWKSTTQRLYEERKKNPYILGSIPDLALGIYLQLNILYYESIK